VILMSGHRYEDVQADLSIGQRSVAFLEKPFTSGILINQVRGALESRC
jgi:FixJ family two-component response regulator